MSLLFFLGRRRRDALPLFLFLSNNFSTGDFPMTKNEFNALCAERTIDPNLALENDELVEALKDRDDKAVVAILDNQF
jgi:hypothetical protein